MRKHPRHSLIPFLLLAWTLVVYAAQDRRKASLEDTAGVKTDVTGVNFEAAAREMQRGYGLNRLVVSTDPLQFLIRLDRVKSVKAERNDTWDVTYVWSDQERQISGMLAYGEFRGASDFGEIKIATSKLKTLVFADPPIPLSEREKSALAENLSKNKAIIVLANGTEVVAGGLRRHYIYYSTEGYIMGGEIRYSESSDFAFKRGESLVTLDFGKLKSLEFGPNNTVTVTLTNGNSASGTLASGRDGISGFSAVSDKGEFFVEPRFVKRIVFAAASVPQ